MTDREPPADPDTRTRRKRPLRRKLLLAAATVVVTLLLLEGVLRIAGVEPKTATVLTRFFRYHPSYGWHGIPDVSHRFATADFDVRISHDADGLRVCGLDSRVDADASFDGRVVWLLGDSVTWGWGVEDGGTYVDVLNELAPEGLAFRNLGVTGFAATQEYLLLKDYFERGRRPDLVMVHYSINDHGEVDDESGIRPRLRAVRGKVELTNHPVPRASRWNLSAWMRRNSLLYNYVHFYVMSLKLKIRAKDREQRYDRGRTYVKPPTKGQLRSLHEAFRRMRNLCTAHGVKLALAVEWSWGREIAETFALDLAIPILDLSPTWERSLEDESAPPLYFRSDPHPNAAGHRLLGETLYPEVTKLLEGG